MVHKKKRTYERVAHDKMATLARKTKTRIKVLLAHTDDRASPWPNREMHGGKIGKIQGALELL